MLVAVGPVAVAQRVYGPRFGNIGGAVRVPIARPGADEANRTLWAGSERETGAPMTVPRPGTT